MNWPKIEAIVYSEEDNPHAVLGITPIVGGTIFQTFQPHAKNVSVYLKNDKRTIPMVQIDKEGYYALLLHEKVTKNYCYQIEYINKPTSFVEDPYLYEPIISIKEIERFIAGIHYTVYEMLGSHKKTIQGTDGILFAVWAPHALRISVVGDFNDWDGRIYQMRRISDSGIFELFIPDANVGDFYKYEIKLKSGITYLKSDPYAQKMQKFPDSASVIVDPASYLWKDSKWIAARKKTVLSSSPLIIYSIHLDAFKINETIDESIFQGLIHDVIRYVVEMKYTHIELLPIMEPSADRFENIHHIAGFYAPASKYGTINDLKFFIDACHEAGIGVILDVTPAYFSNEIYGLIGFDGINLYERDFASFDGCTDTNAYQFNFGKKEVSNFLIANILFWIEQFHVDGIVLEDVASMLYLDYGKEQGGWVPNIYGSNENLEALEFIKHLNSVVKIRNKGVLMIAEETSGWPMVTGPLHRNGLGFDLKWNNGWVKDTLSFFSKDYAYRKEFYNMLLFSMVYTYTENFMIALSYKNILKENRSVFSLMPGTVEDKFMNLRLLYAFMFMHPGKKMLFMGQDMGLNSTFGVFPDPLPIASLKQDNQIFNTYMKQLLSFYVLNPALYEKDFFEEGFEWINSIDSKNCFCAFYRKNRQKENSLLVLCNFSAYIYEKKQIGVSFPGKYKEVFNTNLTIFGGSVPSYSRLKTAKKEKADGKPYSIRVTIPACSLLIFSYIVAVEKTK